MWLIKSNTFIGLSLILTIIACDSNRSDNSGQGGNGRLVTAQFMFAIDGLQSDESSEKSEACLNFLESLIEYPKLSFAFELDRRIFNQQGQILDTQKKISSSPLSSFTFELGNQVKFDNCQLQGNESDIKRFTLYCLSKDGEKLFNDPLAFVGSSIRGGYCMLEGEHQREDALRGRLRFGVRIPLKSDDPHLANPDNHTSGIFSLVQPDATMRYGLIQLKPSRKK